MDNAEVYGLFESLNLRLTSGIELKTLQKLNDQQKKVSKRNMFWIHFLPLEISSNFSFKFHV